MPFSLFSRSLLKAFLIFPIPAKNSNPANATIPRAPAWVFIAFASDVLECSNDELTLVLIYSVFSIPSSTVFAGEPPEIFSKSLAIKRNGPSDTYPLLRVSVALTKISLASFASFPSTSVRAFCITFLNSPIASSEYCLLNNPIFFLLRENARCISPYASLIALLVSGFVQSLFNVFPSFSTSLNIGSTSLKDLIACIG